MTAQGCRQLIKAQHRSGNWLEDRRGVWWTPLGCWALGGGLSRAAVPGEIRRRLCRGQGGAGPGEDTWCSDAFTCGPIQRSGSDLGVVLWQAVVGGTARLVRPRGFGAGTAATRGLLRMCGGALRCSLQCKERRGGRIRGPAERCRTNRVCHRSPPYWWGGDGVSSWAVAQANSGVRKVVTDWRGKLWSGSRRHLADALGSEAHGPLHAQILRLLGFYSLSIQAVGSCAAKRVSLQNCCSKSRGGSCILAA
ncbi:hypothetical protein NDU88_007534 [Pleurodeles waltl]|uniref:Uncharacterized protein n=1 Tax=Pleurodeles waltl TaxID=8319 RepID=A0AAV7VTT7_PLEWA|nr:hypothetical protein NDU88_007534 [Pleurodeles waltl]